MSKWLLALLLLMFSGCMALHDGSGWEHNMEQESNTILEHEH